MSRDEMKWQCLLLAIQALDNQRFKSGDDKISAIMNLAEKMSIWTAQRASNKAAISVAHTSAVRN